MTITVHGVNDAPTANPDSGETLNNDTVVINLLANDTDPDNGATLSIASIDTTGTNGAVTNNGDGTVTYDPSGWAAAQALAPDAQLTDTFHYTVSDGLGGTHTAEVTVTVTGASTNSDPQVVNHIADRTIYDTETQPITYDLATVFSDDGPLTYTATSSNSNLVQVNVSGSTLSITYATYESGMDRTPATITVTATEVGGAGHWVSEQFDVTVVPETTVDVQFVIRDTATPVGETSTATLPDSITGVTVGQNYVVEIWMKDLLDDTVTGGSVSAGLIGGLFDIGYDPAITQGVSMHYEGPFETVHTGTIYDSQGLIDDFGAGTINVGNGINGNYVRLGYVTFQATASGDQVITLSYEDVARKSDQTGSPEVVTGTIDVSQVSLPMATVSQQETVTFTLLHNASSITFGGHVYGEELQPQQASSNFTYFAGTIEAIVTYDSSNEPTSIRIINTDVSVENWSDGMLSPGLGGAAGSDYANAGLTNPSETINYALRNMVIDISCDQPIQLDGSRLDQSTIDFSVSQGNLDYRYVLPGSLDLAGLPIDNSGSSDGHLHKNGNKLELDLDLNGLIDISGKTVTGDNISFYGKIVAEFGLPALTATETSQTAAAADETNLVMTLSKSATALDDNGQVDTLPISEGWIDEWDSYWVEIWARTGEGSGINVANLDLAYNGDYFTAVEIEHGRGFTENISGRHFRRRHCVRAGRIGRR